MDSTNNYQKLVRKFTNHNIFNVTFETLEAEIENTSVITNKIIINAGSDYVTQSFDVKALLMPFSGYNITKESLIPCYKLIKLSKNFKKITRVFLVGYSHLSIKNSIYISPYDFYEVNQEKKSFEIDKTVYEEILKNEVLKKCTEKFDLNSYSMTTFIESNGSIREKEEESTESVEDNEFTFDVHLAFLSHLFERVTIVPIWININPTSHSNCKDILSKLASVLNSYMKKEENFFLFSSNLTYFGRMYNFFGDGKQENKEFKSKSFLRDPKNEEKAKNFVKSLDDQGFDLLYKKNVDALMKISNFNYSRELLSTLIYLISDSNLCEDKMNYQIIRNESIEEGYELNLVSFGSYVYYNLY